MSDSSVLLVRAKPHNHDRESEFKNGVVSIGWPVGSSFEGKTREQIGDLLDENGWLKPIAISEIWNFVNLPPGSIILSPSLETREIHVLVESEPYFYRPELEDDPGTDEQPWGNPHTIKAKYLKSLPREKFPMEVQRALNAARKAVTRFDKYAEKIKAVIAGESNQAGNLSYAAASDLKQEVVGTLRELLRSSEEATRLQAALALKDFL